MASDAQYESQQAGALPPARVDCKVDDAACNRAVRGHRGRGHRGAQSLGAPPTTAGLAALASSLVCGGCGTTVGALEPYPFRCPRSGDGGDHVLRRVLDLSRLEFPKDVGEQNPFIAWRSLLHAYHLASAQGMSDRVFVELVQRLDNEVAKVDGHGFARTPFKPSPSLADRLGTPATVWVKDETGNVAGSHKARHLFGLLVHLEVVRLLGLTEGPLRPLAIASCGNAALAAGVVAAAGGRQLLVFVPTDADPVVLGRLAQLGAEITVCPRLDGVAGDPAYHGLQAAIDDGALPFTCQGDQNGLAIEGAETLGYEMAAELSELGHLDHVVVQVGGGALASAVAQSLSEAVALGVLSRAPRLHTVQTESAWPLAGRSAGFQGPRGRRARRRSTPPSTTPLLTARRTCGHGRRCLTAWLTGSSTTRPTIGSPSSGRCSPPAGRRSW